MKEKVIASRRDCARLRKRAQERESEREKETEIDREYVSDEIKQGKKGFF